MGPVVSFVIGGSSIAWRDCIFSCASMLGRSPDAPAVDDAGCRVSNKIPVCGDVRGVSRRQW